MIMPCFTCIVLVLKIALFKMRLILIWQQVGLYKVCGLYAKSRLRTLKMPPALKIAMSAV